MPSLEQRTAWWSSLGTYRIRVFCLSSLQARYLWTINFHLFWRRFDLIVMSISLQRPQNMGRVANPKPVAAIKTGHVECVCYWLHDATGLDCGDRSWICNAPRLMSTCSCCVYLPVINRFVTALFCRNVQLEVDRRNLNDVTISDHSMAFIVRLQFLVYEAASLA